MHGATIKTMCMKGLTRLVYASNRQVSHYMSKFYKVIERCEKQKLPCVELIRVEEIGLHSPGL